jgi:hypothetical protein
MPKLIEEIEKESTLFDELKKMPFPEAFDLVVRTMIKGVTGKDVVIFKWKNNTEIPPQDEKSDTGI